MLTGRKDYYKFRVGKLWPEKRVSGVVKDGGDATICETTEKDPYARRSSLDRGCSCQEA